MFFAKIKLNTCITYAFAFSTFLCSISRAQTAEKMTLTYQDHFENLDNWITELQQPGEVTTRDGEMIIDVPAGATIWFKPLLTGPLKIQYEAMVISAGGTRDRVSDLNCFWMARDARNRNNLFLVPRTGAFTDYDELYGYYVGLGGNNNTTTRFRRYIGQRDNRPLLPEHDLKTPLIVPNIWHTISLIADGNKISYVYDGKELFNYQDPQPYQSGWFALRTVASHLKIRKFEVLQQLPLAQPKISTTQPK